MKCFFGESCKEKLVYQSSCEKGVYSCVSHFKFYLRKGTGFSLSLISEEATEESAEAVLKKYYTKIEDLNNSASKIQKNSKHLIELIEKNTTKVLKEIQKMIKNLYYIIKEHGYKNTFSPDCTGLSESDLFSEVSGKEFENELIECIIDSMYSRESLKNLKKTKESCLNKQKPVKYTSDYIFYANPDNEARGYDLDSYSEVSLKDVQSAIRFSCASVLVSHNLFFVFGGYEGLDLVGKAQLVYLNEKKIIDARSYSPCASSASCNVNGFVFVFGGRNSFSEISDSAVFDLVADRWSSIANLPENSERNTSSFIYSSVYITGYNLSSLLQYDIENNIYKEVKRLKKNSFKYVYNNYIVAFNDHLYSFDDQNRINKYYRIREIGEPLTNYSGVSKDRYIYFVSITENIYRIDLVNKRLDFIRFRDL